MRGLGKRIVRRLSRPLARLSMFWQFFILYLTVFLLSVTVMFSTMLPTSMRSAVAIDRDRQENLEQRTREYIDEILVGINTVQSRIERSEWLNDLYIYGVAVGRELSDEEREDIRSSLMEYTTQFPYIKMVSFHLYGLDVLFNTTGAVENWRKYEKYDSDASLKYRFFDLEDGDEAGLSSQSYENGELRGEELIYRSEITNLYKTYYNRAKGQLNIALELWRIRSGMMKLLPGEAKGFKLTDKQGNVLVDDYRLTDGAEMLEIELQMERGGYTLKLYVEKELMNRSEKTMMETIVSIITLDTVICLIAVFLFARINYLPIHNLSANIEGGDSQCRNELIRLDDGIRLMQMEKAVTLRELDAARPLFRQRFLLNLLLGVPVLAEDVRRMESCGIVFSYPLFRVIEVWLPQRQIAGETGESLLCDDAAFAGLVEIPDETRHLSVYCQAAEVGQYSLIVNYECEAELREYLQQLFADSTRDLTLRGGANAGCFSVGGAVDAMEHIAASRKEASRMLNRQLIHEAFGVFWVDDIGGMNQTCYRYGISDEILLMDTMSNGREEAALAALNRVLQENIAYAGESVQNAAYLYYDLISTMHKTLHALGLPVELLKVHGCECAMEGGLATIRPCFEKIVRQICREVNAQAGEGVQQESIEQQIISYIHKNLYDPMLSLSGIADSFGLSQSYVSVMIKAQTGIVYSEYVNKARIQEAVRLLEETTLSVEEVMQRCGYVSHATFRRNFTRYTNTTPGQIQRKSRADDGDAPKPAQ